MKNITRRDFLQSVLVTIGALFTSKIAPKADSADGFIVEPGMTIVGNDDPDIRPSFRFETESIQGTPYIDDDGIICIDGDIQAIYNGIEWKDINACVADYVIEWNGSEWTGHIETIVEN